MAKVGLDIHGVIDADPGYYAKLSEMLVKEGHEVHVITGASQTSELETQLAEWGIEYTDFFSIVDHHTSIGTYIEYEDDDRNKFYMNEDLWNISKANYCYANNIDFHIDDSAEYGKYFKNIPTRYSRASIKERDAVKLLREQMMFRIIDSK